MQLRDYQEEALGCVKEAYYQGTHRLLVCMATGLGKTILMAALPLYIKPRPSDTMMVLVNRDELVIQTVDKLRKVHPNSKIGIEKAQSRAGADCEFVVASVQTLHEERLNEVYHRFGQSIGIMLIDECHHSTAGTYRKIADRFFDERPDGLLVGVTATPQRADGEGLGIIFDKTVFHRDMKWAIDNGYLVPVQSFKVTSSVSLDDVDTDKNGDFAVGQLAEAVDTVSRNELAVAAYIQHTPGRKAIAFCSSIKHAEHLADVFRAHGVNADWAHGGTKKGIRAETVDKFRSGEVMVLCNAALWIEGFDVPDAEVMIDTRPTASSSMYVQMTGRVLRPLDEVASRLGLDTTAEQRRAIIAKSKKPMATILDIVDQTRKHSLISLPTLYGLPPKFDAEGISIEKVLEKFEELAAKNPVAAKKVTTLREIQTAIEAVDVFAVPVQPPEVVEVSSMSWRMTGDERYSLTLPLIYEAKMADGSNIANFAKRYRAKLSEARVKGAHPREKYAQEQIGFDQKSFRAIREIVEIRPGVMSSYDVLLHREGKPRVLGSVDTFSDAFHRAESWIEHNRGDLMSSLSAKASWRAKEITPNQIRTLQAKFGVPMHLIPANRGDADVLITKLIDEKRWKKPA